jgi:azurin
MKALSLSVICGLGLLAFASCGGNNKTSDENKNKVEFSDENEATKVAPTEPVTIVLTADDNMHYDQTVLHAKPGQLVKFTLKNIGKLPIEQMGHDFVLLKKGTDIQTFATDAAKAKTNGYFPVEDQEEVIAHTEMIGGGDSTSIEFTAPAEEGDYPYLCTFPGHWGTMKGFLVVGNE